MEKQKGQINKGRKLLIMLRNLVIYGALYFIIVNGVGLVTLFIMDHNEAFAGWARKNIAAPMAVNDIVALIIMYFLVGKMNRVRRKQAYNFSKISPKAMGVIAIVGITIGLFTTAFCEIPLIAEKFPIISTILLIMVNSDNIIIFIIFLLLNSVYKEVLFRGLIYNDMKESMPKWIAMILQGIMYGALFFIGNIPLTIYGLLGALLFVFLYEWYGTLLAPYIAQVTSTGSIFIYVRFADKLITSNSIKFIIPITLIISGVAIYILAKNKDEWSLKAENQKVEIEV